MATTPLTWRQRIDRAGIVLSGLCAVHCVASILVISFIGLGGGWLLSPAIHHWGLAVAIAIAAFAIGLGALRHRNPVPLVIAVTGLALMGTALAAPHGVAEAMLTIAGVALVSLGHVINLRHAHQGLSGGA